MKFIVFLLTFLSLNLFANDDVAKITLSQSNVVVMNTAVSGESVAKAMAKIQELNAIAEDNSPIYLVLDTPGGSVMDGINFIRFAKTSRRPVETVTLFAASMGFQIVEALGTRYMTENSTLMAHRAAVGGIGGQFPGELNTRVGYLMEVTNSLDESVVKRTKGKQTKESYANLIRDEYYAFPKKAIKDGFADKEATVSCDASLNGVYDTDVATPFGMLSVTFSSCPLITYPVGIKFKEKNEINANKSAFTEYMNTLSIKN